MNYLMDMIRLGRTEPIITPSRANFRLADSGPGHYQNAAHAADIAIEEPALRIVQAHALSRRHEITGILVGSPPMPQLSGRYRIHIIDAIIAADTVAGPGYVTWTADSWIECDKQRMARYPNGQAVVVGWYHSSPNQGISLSAIDLFLHRQHFSKPYQVALVVDPTRRLADFYTWHRNLGELLRYHFAFPPWVNDAW